MNPRHRNTGSMRRASIVGLGAGPRASLATTKPCKPTTETSVDAQKPMSREIRPAEVFPGGLKIEHMTAPRIENG